MTSNTKIDLKQAFAAVLVPGIEQPAVDIGRLKRAEVIDGVAHIGLELGIPFGSVAAALEQRVAEAVLSLPGVSSLNLELDSKLVARSVQQGVKALPGVANIIAVASGKGGVGKSTTAANLALALATEGAKVGILDADIYGPSVPLMLGLSGERPQSEDGKSMEPLLAHGLQVMSIGFLIDPDQPMVWRGPMVTQALHQLMYQTRWSDLDYLIVDMPPGTGDIQLTLTQKVPVSGAVIVTTPQDLALLDARKGLQMFRKVSVSVLGIVENMSTHICTQCGHAEALFGSGGGASLAAEYDVKLLGQLPLDIRIREQVDGGRPSVVADPDGAVAGAYRLTALRMAAQLALQSRDYSHRFPNIVVEDKG